MREVPGDNTLGKGEIVRLRDLVFQEINILKYNGADM
jgi:hypothetical protein